MISVRLMVCFFCYCIAPYFLMYADEVKAPRTNSHNVAGCVSCSQEETSIISDCVCDELTVLGNTRIHDNLIVQGTAKIKENMTIEEDLLVKGSLHADEATITSLLASVVEISCGSSLDCDLFVQNDATITNDLTVGGTLGVDVITATTSIIVPTFETECGSTLNCDLFVQNDVAVINDLSVGGSIIADTIMAETSIIAPIFETDCGSSLDCDLFVQDDAIVTNDLTVGGTLSVDVITATTSIITPTFETDCGSTLDCDLFVQDDAIVANDLSVGGSIIADTITAETSIISPIFETTCGSTLNCDLFVFDDATIGDALTVGCDVSVGCNIIMNNTTDAAHGNIMKAGERFMHNAGDRNTFLGQQSGTFTVTGTDTVGIGYQAATQLSSGLQNTAVGSSTLTKITIINDNTAIGFSALRNHEAVVDICTPLDPFTAPIPFPVCLYAGTANTAVGSGALQENITGSFNVAVGTNALAASTTNFNTSDCAIYPPENVAAGAGSAPADWICTFAGERNTAIGTSALANVEIGSDNIALGTNAGINSINGFNNIYIGNAGCVTSLQPPLSTFPFVFPEKPVGTDVNENNVIRIGNLEVHTDFFIAGVFSKTLSAGSPVFINDRGELGTVVSSERFKEDIRPFDGPDLLKKIMQLQAVVFRYKNDAEKRENVGLIAEEVAQIFPELVIYSHGKPLSVRYDLLAVLCIAALQRIEEQHTKTTRTIEMLDKKIELLEQTMKERLSERL